MAESKGPGNEGGAAGGGGTPKRKRGFLDRLRPYAVGTTAIVVVFGGSALIGEHVRSTKDDKVREPSGVAAAPVVPTGPADTATPSPSASPGPKLGLPVRPTIPVTLTVYVDLRSPDSKAFADEYEATLTQLLTTGQVELQYRLVTASDKQYGGSGSKEAANAAACAQDQGRFSQFMREVWKHQPDPSSDTLSHKNFLKEMARKAGKIKMGNFEPCLEQGDHNGWVTQSQKAFAASGLGQVPVLEINGKAVKDVHSTLTPQKLRKMVLDEAKRVIAVQATPSATSTLLG
ncbi:DsbA family protein [Actinacidiphila alni]|uniref:DsbA family protein n=1 Tax=Actinacidiphila alni TaxID=380248 RepID=UPI00345178EA